MTIAYRAAEEAIVRKRHEFEMGNPHNDSMPPESFLPLKGDHRHSAPRLQKLLIF